MEYHEVMSRVFRRAGNCFSNIKNPLDNWFSFQKLVFTVLDDLCFLVIILSIFTDLVCCMKYWIQIYTLFLHGNNFCILAISKKGIFWRGNEAISERLKSSAFWFISSKEKRSCCTNITWVFLFTILDISFSFL